MATNVRTRDGGPATSRSASRRSRGEAPFRYLSTAAGVALLAIMAAIAVFLISEAIPALQANKANFFTELTWEPNSSREFGIAALAFGTVLSSLLALVIATPVAVGVALFISHYAPRRLAAPLGYLIDLLAAVPSVVYGLWGVAFLVPLLRTPSQWLNENLGWFPLFAGEGIIGGKTMIAGAVVLAIMILPIIAAISREVFLQAPKMNEEAALALGATRWEMIRMAVLPFGRPGVISAAMLGLGRAMGETIAVALIFPATFDITFQILTPHANSIAANIANGFGEANDIGRGALIASGLVLFIITLLVNMAARFVINRRKEYARAGA
ncbi:Phosphate transport system permease protein PstC (TC 3.A.1.7.1) [[Actinomadura] parvosata subsp. kistnae]|uniref:Phosphate transport system permease protein n=1 Tax=[Actinomadura] parvosata subsp. kistnae TaxID=1909395 RepID=A0A1V0AFD6_9ACTN|nr:phosphate ABC transporter permease subunit PstC [Nonomuraea sp. ATCC 55076]AQZ68927.1 phosphate ABC transporter permease subunit PstC [Nonomuraea sp. ATCC 55076]SPL92523.1 Phosphate transport system permease protein PstC (TC 3.A.1.7.1) [Actinomadura parvosata subsp. kistnae]